MENRIEQEINKTLQYMGNDFDIQVSAVFAENLSSRIANMRVSRSVGYRNRAFYPVAIVLLVALNFAACLASFKGRQPVNNVSNNQVSVLANEYGIGQSSYMTF